MLSKFKDKLKVIIRVLAFPFLKLNTPPNFITLLGLLLSLVALALVNIDSVFTLYAILFLVLSSIMDSVDGYIAREKGRKTSFGAFLDSTVDRVEDFVAILVSHRIGVVDFYILLILLIGAYLVSYTRARAEALGITMNGVGIAERGERLILLYVAIILYFFSRTASLGVIYFLILLTYVTILQRIHHVWKNIGGKRHDSS